MFDFLGHEDDDISLAVTGFAHDYIGVLKQVGTVFSPLACDVTIPNSALTEINGDISMAESCERRVHLCTFPLCVLSDGDQYKRLRSFFLS